MQEKIDRIDLFYDTPNPCLVNSDITLTKRSATIMIPEPHNEMSTLFQQTTALSKWDLSLLCLVTTQAIFLSYCHSPKLKAWIWSLPIPFTLTTLAVGHPIQAAHAAGLPLVFVFVHLVRLIHQQWKKSILLAVFLALSIYMGISFVLYPILPSTPVVFWLFLAISMGIGGWVLHRTPHLHEPGHRSAMPVIPKTLCVMGIIILVLILKHRIGGFAALFPIMTTLAAYEARHSLTTLYRQMGFFVLAFVPVLAECFLLQDRLGLPMALAMGWLIYLPLLRLLQRVGSPPKSDRNFQ